MNSIFDIRKVVIPVAGKGTRFLPASKDLPKEMIPIINIPMIHYVVKEAVDAGIEEVIFVTSEGKEAILKYFLRNKRLESFLQTRGKLKEYSLVKEIGEMVKFHVVEQTEQLGLGHAILCAKKIIGKENFAVILGDDLTVSEKPVIKQVMDVFEKYRAAAAIGVMLIPREETGQYGVIEPRTNLNTDNTCSILSMVEKPQPKDSPSCLATPGRYVFTPEIFDCLERISLGAGGEYQLTDGINLLSKEKNVMACKFDGERFDTGNIKGYLEATVEFALRDPKYSNIMKSILKEKYLNMENCLE